MSAARLMFAVVAVAIIMVGGLAAVGYATWESGDATAVTNETFQTGDNVTVELENSNLENTLYSSTVNVTNTSDTVVYESEGNYTWHDHNGTIFVNGTGDLAEEPEAHISYEYSETSSEAFGFMQLFASIGELGDALVIALMAATVIAAARVFGGVG